MKQRPDKFQDTMVDILIGIVLMFVIAAFMSAGVKAIKALDADGGLNAPSSWKGR